MFDVNSTVLFKSPITGDELVGTVTKKLTGVFVDEREVKSEGNFYWVKCIDMIALPENSEEGELL